MKTELNYTPGPWAFDAEEMNIYNHVGASICTVSRRPKIVGKDNIEKSGLSIETMANAKLLEAAPKLLQMLQECLVICDQYASDDPYEDMVTQEARKVIKEITE